MVDRAFLLLFLSGMPKVPFGHLLLAQLITQLQILQPHYTPPGDSCQEPRPPRVKMRVVQVHIFHRGSHVRPFVVFKIS